MCVYRVSGAYIYTLHTYVWVNVTRLLCCLCDRCDGSSDIHQLPLETNQSAKRHVSKQWQKETEAKYSLYFLSWNCVPYTLSAWCIDDTMSHTFKALNHLFLFATIEAQLHTHTHIKQQQFHQQQTLNSLKKKVAEEKKTSVIMSNRLWYRIRHVCRTHRFSHITRCILCILLLCAFGKLFAKNSTLFSQFRLNRKCEWFEISFILWQIVQICSSSFFSKRISISHSAWNIFFAISPHFVGVSFTCTTARTHIHTKFYQYTSNSFPLLSSVHCGIGIWCHLCSFSFGVTRTQKKNM